MGCDRVLNLRNTVAGVADAATRVAVEHVLRVRHDGARAVRPPLAAPHLAIGDTTNRLLVAARTQTLVFRQLGQPRTSDSWPAERHCSESIASVGGTPELGEGLAIKGDLELEGVLTTDAVGELRRCHDGSDDCAEHGAVVVVVAVCRCPAVACCGGVLHVAAGDDVSTRVSSGAQQNPSEYARVSSVNAGNTVSRVLKHWAGPEDERTGAAAARGAGGRGGSLLGGGVSHWGVRLWE
jgi:hypothetical protein